MKDVGTMPYCNGIVNSTSWYMITMRQAKSLVATHDFYAIFHVFTLKQNTSQNL